MKNIKSYFVVAAVAAASIAMAPQAQAQHTYPGTAGPTSDDPGAGPGNRQLDFSPNDAFSTTGSGDNQTTFSATGSINTVVHVRPYLYVTGVLGGDWDVDGWGEGTKTTAVGEQYLDIYHSNPIVITSDDWENPLATSGVAQGHDIPMRYSASSKNAAGGNITFVNASNFAVGHLDQLDNDVIYPDGTGGTLGHARINLRFTLIPNAGTYSGTYRMNPTLVFTSQE